MNLSQKIKQQKINLVRLGFFVSKSQNDMNLWKFWVKVAMVAYPKAVASRQVG
jgi:hypothetical protein